MKHWNGRFKEELDSDALQFSSSLEIDKRLYREDIEGSLAHVSMLAKQGILSIQEAKKIRKALLEILKEIDLGTFSFEASEGTSGRFVAEDVHMAIERRLTEKVGTIGGKLHTARSRNDQVALDERLYLRRAIISLLEYLIEFQKALVRQAEQNKEIIMPGYTHLQRAQPILLAHHLLTYVSMIERDKGRFFDCYQRVNLSPLGAAAFAGTSFPIDRKFVAKELDFDGIIESSIDAVSDRDVHIEFISACAITMMHLSRLAEEFVIWSSTEWNFIEIGDAYTTGSSIMPQKKNPDMAELIRGKTGRVYGDLIALLTVMKGLPLSYNRDMQEDKEPLFDAADTLQSSLHIFTGMLPSTSFHANRFEKEFESGYMAATDIADYLVHKGLPFREAHAIVGAIVKHCSQTHLTLNKLSLTDYQRFSPAFTEDIFTILSPKESIRLKQSSGSTSPKEVNKAIRYWKKGLSIFDQK